MQVIIDEIIRCSRPKQNRTAAEIYDKQRFLTTGDAQIDEVLGGGVPLGCITEFVGESGVGKSQVLTQLCVTTQLNTSIGGMGKEVIYISTESGLATSRAQEMAASLRELNHHREDALPPLPLNNIHVVVCPDLELQDHMLYYQVPELLKQKRGKIGCIIVDSIAANYRAEHTGRDTSGIDRTDDSRRAGDMGLRTRDLLRVAAHLRSLAMDHNLAVVVANQVSDRFEREQDDDVMTLDHQSQWFSGWKSSDKSPKNPALGLVWANSVRCRIALKMKSASTDRELSVVYSPFAPYSSIGYKITIGGIVAV